MTVLQSDSTTGSPASMDDIQCHDSSEIADTFVYKRSDVQGFPTGIVGDVGTCKINRSVRNRNNTAYGWSTEIPGDMHTKGHLCEAVFKAHKLVHTVMKRQKLTEEAFKKRKFQEQKLQHIQEAVKDGSFAYGFAAVHKFKCSDEFPSDDDLRKALRKMAVITAFSLQDLRNGWSILVNVIRTINITSSYFVCLVLC